VSAEPSAGQPSGAQYLGLVGLGAAIGIPAAFAAALFLGFVHILEGWLWYDLPDALGYSSPPWFLVLGLPVAGAAFVLLVRRLLPGDGGHEPLEGLSSTPTPIAHAPGIVLAALGTLGFGAVLGPEAPIIALGSAIGVAVTLLVTLSPRETAVISSAGSFSAISALFGGPIVAGMLLVEGGLTMGTMLLPALVPGFVAAAVGYVIFVGFGHWGGLHAPGLVVPELPLYSGTHIYDIMLAVAIGLLAAIVVLAVRLLGARVKGLRPRLGTTTLLLLGGLAVGALALLGEALGADSQDVLFSGQASVPVVVTEDSTRIVLVLLAAKFLAYAVSLGCGFRGGPIFPAVFLGVGLASLAVVWVDVSPTLAVAAGAAAGMAAQARLLISAMIFGSLLVGTQNVAVVPATVLAAVSAWVAVAVATRARASSEAARSSAHGRAAALDPPDG
jgi:H+/Cl- antiporter ClcA